jgi:hypothetical protein
MLNRTEVIVSVDVGKERSEMGALLNSGVLRLPMSKNIELTLFHPKFERCWKRLQITDLSGGDLSSWDQVESVGEDGKKRHT